MGTSPDEQPPVPPPAWPPPPPAWPPPPQPGWGWGPPGWGPPPLPKAGSARTGPLPLHPMTMGDVLDGAFKLLKANARTVVLVTALFVVPLQLLAAFLQRDLLGGAGLLEVFDDPSTGDLTGDPGNGQALATLLAAVASVVVLPFVAGAISRVVAASYLGDELGAGPALAATLRRWWALVASWFLVHVLEWAGWILAGLVLMAGAFAGSPDAGTIGAAVLLALAGFPVALVMMALFVAVAPAIVVEELGPIRAMRRSARLLRRRLWGVMGIAIASGLLAGVLGSALGFVPQMLALLVGTDRGGWLLLALGGILPSLVTTPFIAIVATLVYFDGRIRHEGFDLQVIASDLARSGAPAHR